MSDVDPQSRLDADARELTDAVGKVRAELAAIQTAHASGGAATLDFSALESAVADLETLSAPPVVTPEPSNGPPSTTTGPGTVQPG